MVIKMSPDFDLEFKKRVKINDSLKEVETLELSSSESWYNVNCEFSLFMVLFFVFVWCLVYVLLSNALSWTFPRIFDGLVLSDFPCHYALITKKDFNILVHDILDAEFHTFMISTRKPLISSIL